MAKKFYVPVSNLSDEVKKILVSTGGLSDYAVKGYCSVNGLSKQFFGASQPQPTGKVIFENGSFTNLTSPSCQRKTITYGGAVGQATSYASDVITSKDIGWTYSNSQTANYPWSFINDKMVSGDVYNMAYVGGTGSDNALLIPVLNSILNPDMTKANDVAAKIKVTLIAKERGGPFYMGAEKVGISSGGTYFFSTSIFNKRFNFSANPSESEFPLNETVTLEKELTNYQLQQLVDGSHNGYWWVIICAPPNQGSSPKFYVEKIEYEDIRV